MVTVDFYGKREVERNIENKNLNEHLNNRMDACPILLVLRWHALARSTADKRIL